MKKIPINENISNVITKLVSIYQFICI